MIRRELTRLNRLKSNDGSPTDIIEENEGKTDEDVDAEDGVESDCNSDVN